MSSVQKHTAESFSHQMQVLGFNCDYSLHSLLVEVDKILNSPDVSFSEKGTGGHQNLAGLEAYIGESLRSLYGGKWKGRFVLDTPASNYYTSYMRFGEFDLHLARFIAYRLSNGEAAEGTFADYLRRALPKITGNSSPPQKLLQAGSATKVTLYQWGLISICLLIVIVIAYSNERDTPPPDLKWQDANIMKAELTALSIHPDTEYVYQRFVEIARQVPEMITQTRQKRVYDPHLMGTLSVWKASLETLQALDTNIPRDCDTWDTALRFTWGEDETSWDQDTQNLWGLVTRFCEPVPDEHGEIINSQ